MLALAERVEATSADATASPRPVLVTGPGGRVGTSLRRHWGARYRLRLFDRRPLGEVAAHETAVVGSILDLDALRAAARGCKAMVHLAATPDEADFVSELMPNNVHGLYNAFEAARLEGVRRFVMASTVQTLLGYPRTQFVSDSDPVRPVTLYACTKVLAEAVGRYYHDRFGMEVVCLRLGWVMHPDEHRPERGGLVYLSPRDCAGFVAGAVDADPAPGAGYVVISVLSRNGRGIRDLGRATRLLGYAARDDSGAG